MSFSRHDRFINFGLLIRNQQGRDCVTHLVDTINAEYKISKNIWQHNALVLIICNAVYYQYSPLIISLNNSSYKTISRYNKCGVGSAAFQSIIKTLHRNGLIDKRFDAFAGYKRSESTVITIQEKLRAFCAPYHGRLLSCLKDDSELVILRKTEKTKDEITNRTRKIKYPCEYRDDKFSKAARAFLKKYNQWLHQPRMSLPIPVEHQAALFEGLTHEEIHRLTDTYLNNRELRRIFIAENGRNPKEDDKPLPKLGGRFYGGFWIDNIPSAARLYLRIDKQPCVELDFRAMNVTMLYMLETGAPWLEYPYDSIPLPNHPEKRFPKALVKPFFTWCINTETRDKALGTLRAKLAKELDGDEETKPHKTFLKNHRLNYEQFIDAILERHPAIAHRFFDGTVIGKELQFHDGQIAERIMKACFKEEIYCLPIHDAMLVEKKHKEQVKEIMVRTLCKYFKVEFKPEYLERLLKEDFLPEEEGQGRHRGAYRAG